MIDKTSNNLQEKSDLIQFNIGLEVTLNYILL